MFCNGCGAPNPDGSTFCARCGRPMGGASGAVPGAPPGMGAPPPPPPPPPRPQMDLKNLKCTACGAPLHLDGPIAVATCEYCGSTITLSGDGWKNIQAHSMLIPQVIDQDGALAACKKWMDSGGFLHKHESEHAKLVEAKCQVVPYWIVPATAITHYQYEDAAVAGAAIGGSIAASALMGAALSQGGRGVAVVPMFGVGGAGQMAKRAAELSGNYQFPIIAVKGLENLQPKEYQFDLSARVPYDKRKLPANLPLLNGDVSEDDAKYIANNLVTQLQAAKAHAQHHMVQQINTQVNVSQAELLHAPVWYVTFETKSNPREVLTVDAARNAVMNSPKPR